MGKKIFNLSFFLSENLMPSWEETERYEIVNEEVEDIPEITSTGKKAFLTLSFP